MKPVIFIANGKVHVENCNDCIIIEYPVRDTCPNCFGELVETFCPACNVEWLEDDYQSIARKIG
jgi:hypothetical protein